jgi:RNA polymerase sigma-70 factor (ECF subfamily)
MERFAARIDSRPRILLRWPILRSAGLARVALGDRVRFERVYQATSAHLFGVAIRILGRREAAEDVLQEAFVSVWHHAGSYQAASSQPMTWLISVVRNKALDVVRSAAVRHETAMPAGNDGEEVEFADERPGALALLMEGARPWRFAAA